MVALRNLPPRPLFDPGRVVATPAAIEAAAHENPDIEVVEFVHRHVCGDFGTEGHYDEIILTKQEKSSGPLATDNGGRLNALAIDSGEGRILSVYELPKTGVRLFVETAGDWSSTTVCLAEEY